MAQMLDVTVTEPRIHKKGYTIYKVSIKFKHHSETSIDTIIWKRYNDFKLLYKELKGLYATLKNNQEQYPHFSKSKYFGRFQQEVIQERCKWASNFIKFILGQPILRHSSFFKKFLEASHSIDEITCSQTQEENRLSPVDNGPSIVIHTVNGLVPDKYISGNDNEYINNTVTFNLDSDSSLKLGGTWNFPQLSDTISISSTSSDDRTSCTESDSILSETPSPSKNITSLAETIGSDAPSSSKQINNYKTISSKNDNPSTSSISQHPPIDYMLEAACHIGQAQRLEADGEPEGAFALYKTAIACLLSGAQDDPDSKRRLLVQIKTAQYLSKAEKLYAEHLNPAADPSIDRWKCDQRLLQHEVNKSQLLRPLSELKAYKVIKLIYNKVMLARNLIEDKLYIIKVMLKSPCPLESQQGSIMPQNIPFMVKLYKYFETDSAFYLILEHISSGRLWDHVGGYLESGPATPVKQQRHPNQTEMNRYHGRKVAHILKNSKQDSSDIVRDPSDLDTTDLVKNAQKLIESVSRTLKRSEEIKVSQSPTKNINKSESKTSREEISIQSGGSRVRAASGSLDRSSRLSRLVGARRRPNLPEWRVRTWAAQIIVALDALHRQGLIHRDLNPGHILVHSLNDEGEVERIVIGYQCIVEGVDAIASSAAIRALYAAPEASAVGHQTLGPAADWWSLGAIIYELLTAKTLISCHPGGIQFHSNLWLPDFLSEEASSLLKELLRYNPQERLGYAGIEELKAHSFFNDIDWLSILNLGFS